MSNTRNQPRSMSVFSITRISGGEGGIRTPGRSFGPYNGLANRRIQPLCHLSAVWFQQLSTVFYWPAALC